jgi:predicted nucleic acid-binding Zn ribbon protein
MRGAEKGNAMKLDDLPDETCALCGKGFEARTITQKYCSRKCRKKSNYTFDNALVAQARKAERDKLRCHVCGGPIPDAGSTHRKYCSICRPGVKREQHRIRTLRWWRKRRAARAKLGDAAGGSSTEGSSLGRN